jgi:quercetin dioxygenase-like cupin family protein
MTCAKRTVSKGGDLVFRETLVEIRLSVADHADGLSIVEHRMPCGEAPPLHVHRNEDEIFYLLRGTIRFEVGGDTLTAWPGDVVVAPKGVPPRFVVTSEDGAHCLTIMKGGDFETVIREVSHPATPLETRPADDTARLLAALARNHIDVVGPPLAA